MTGKTKTIKMSTANLTNIVMTTMKKELDASAFESFKDVWTRYETTFVKSLDTKKPKRAKTAYNCYAAKRSKEIKTEDKTKTLGEISKLVSAEWKTMSEEDKHPYTKEASKDKERYNTEMKELGMHVKTKEKSKRPPSAYILFCNDKRPALKKKYPDKKMTDLSKMMGEMWTEAKETGKSAKYTKKAFKLKEEYESSKGANK